MENIDISTVEGFGREWSSFDQSCLNRTEKKRIFREYFQIFPEGVFTRDATGLDLGCGSGRWATLVAPLVGTLHLADASASALKVAGRNLKRDENCVFHHASVEELPFNDDSLDFVYSLGVLHHVPDTQSALGEVNRILKPGAPFLVYLYYAFDNRPHWFRLLWRASDAVRRAVSVLPYPLRYWFSQMVAAFLYLPLSRAARLLERMGRLPGAWPLAYYRDKSFYTLRTDALDRFGTRLEKRFTQKEISRMLVRAGFKDVRFSDKPPYWVAVCHKA